MPRVLLFGFSFPIYHLAAGILLAYSLSSTCNQCRMKYLCGVSALHEVPLTSGVAWHGRLATTFALSGGGGRGRRLRRWYGIGSARKSIFSSRLYRHFLWQWIVPRDKNGSSTQRLREIVVQMHCNCRLTWILFLTIFNPIILRSSPPSLSNILRTERSLMAATYADQR